MKTIIDVSHPTQQDIDQGSQELDAMANHIGEGAVILEPKERQSLPRPRRGGFQYIPTIAALARRYGVDTGAVPVDQLEAKLAWVQRFEPLVLRVGQLHQLLNDMLLIGESDVWEMATSTYTMLQRVARRNAALRQDLSGVRSFFQFRGPRGGAAKSKAQPATVVVVNGHPATNGVAGAAAAAAANGANAAITK